MPIWMIEGYTRVPGDRAFVEAATTAEAVERLAGALRQIPDIETLADDVWRVFPVTVPFLQLVWRD